MVCTDSEQLGRLATVWEYARHAAGSAATVCLVAPDPAGGYERDSVQYDLGQATMSISSTTWSTAAAGSAFRPAPQA